MNAAATRRITDVAAVQTAWTTIGNPVEGDVPDLTAWRLLVGPSPNGYYSFFFFFFFFF